MKKVRAKKTVATDDVPTTKLDARNKMVVVDRVVSVNSSSNS